MKKRLIALMLASTITAAALTGCGENPDYALTRNSEEEIRPILDYDANTNIEKYNSNRGFGLGVEYEIDNNKFYIIFIFYKLNKPGHNPAKMEDARIKYEVDKDTYYNFRNEFTTYKNEEDVEMVKVLTTKFDPVEVVNSKGEVINSAE